MLKIVRVEGVVPAVGSGRNQTDYLAFRNISLKHVVNVHVELTGGDSKTFQVGASKRVNGRLLEENLAVPENDPGVNLYVTAFQDAVFYL